MSQNAMGLVIPLPTITTGPEYATQVSNDLQIISGHTHTGASNDDGYQIPSEGLNINADLSIQSNNLTSLRSTRFTNQSSVLSGIGDVGCAYEKSGDLWYNNSAGTPIQLTSGSAILFTNVINYALLAIAANHTINSADVVTLLECNSSANTIIVTLPSISSVPVGRFYIIKDFQGTSENFAITINPSGTNTIDHRSTYTIADNHAAIGVVSDGVGNWSLYEWNRKVYFAGEVIKLTNGAQITGDAISGIILDGYLISSSVTTDSLEVTGDAELSSLTVTGETSLNILTSDIVFNKTNNDFNMTSPTVTGASNSDSFSVITGSVVNGNAGAIILQAGNAVAGNGGSLTLLTGSSASGQPGDMVFTTGTGVVGSSIFFIPGAGTDNGIGFFSVSTSTSQFGGGAHVIFIGQDTTDPTTNPSNGIILYVDASGNLKARTSAGNTRTIAAV